MTRDPIDTPFAADQPPARSPRWVMRIATHMACAVAGAALALAVVAVMLQPASEAGHRLAVTRHRLAVVGLAIRDYRAVEGEHLPGLDPAAASDPPSQAGAQALRRFLPEGVPVGSDGDVIDAWGRPITYRLLDCGRARKRLEVISAGPNGIAEEGAGDDEIWIGLIE